DGVSNSKDLPDLEVKAEEDMNVSLGAGYMFANGYMYFNDSKMKLELDTADDEQSRIDRIIIRFNSDPEERTIKARILKGTPASSPKPPEITREGKDGYIHDMSVAQIYVTAGQSYVEDSDITDERANDEVCGYIPLHNIYRGLDINEEGMITMHKQSYIEMNDTSGLVLDKDEEVGEPAASYNYQRVDINPIIDRQSEIVDGEFHVKQSGTYLFSCHVRREPQGASDYEDRKKIEGFFVVNNEEKVNDRLYVFNHFVYQETQFYGSNIRYLESGDVVRFIMARRYDIEIPLDYVRLNIAKLN